MPRLSSIQSSAFYVRPMTRKPYAPSSIDYLVIAGGGGGGGGGYYQTPTSPGGGGGAGGWVEGSALVTAGVAYTITVGNGGLGGNSDFKGASATQGGNSTIALSGTVLFTAIGGGRGPTGATYNSFANGFNGGSGSGATSYSTSSRGTGGFPIGNQGTDGGQGASMTTASNQVGAGGGGGAGSPGGNATKTSAGSGGAGRYSTIFPTIFHSAGGAGGYTTTIAYGSVAGGIGYGGQGGRYGPNSPVNTYTYGQDGAKGRIIIRYPIDATIATTTGSVTRTTSGKYQIYTFTGSGTITFTLPPP